MRIAFYGAAHEVTGSCTVIFAGGKTIMVDCGMEQGPDLYENIELPVLPSGIDYLLLTHAHIDHSGKIPALVKSGFRGHIYTTSATEKLCSIMLMDSAYIQEFEAKWRNKKAARAGESPYVPMYTAEDVEKAMRLFVSCEYGKEYSLCDGVQISFTDAGHLLGSASISVTVSENGREETIVFSGDLGNHDRPLIKNPDQPRYADYVVIESTYGNRLHGEVPNYVAQLAEVIQRTLDKGGNLVIPSFAVGRTQELLYMLRIIKEEQLIKRHPNFPVYLDSPLAIEATEIYRGNLRDYYDKETLALIDKGIDPIHFDGLRLSVTSEDSVKINADKSPKVIISASGMCEAGRIRHHLKHNLWRDECCVLFVGYQAEGTLGRIIVDGVDTVKLFGDDVKVAAEIARLEGISSHADREMLLEWLDGFDSKPKTVFVNHGADTVCDDFARTIESRLQIYATAPYIGSEYDLISGVCVEKGNTVRKKKVPAQISKKGKNSPAYRQLQSSTRRLASLVDRMQGFANKDLARLASQINSICDKWER